MIIKLDESFVFSNIEPLYFFEKSPCHVAFFCITLKATSSSVILGIMINTWRFFTCITGNIVISHVFRSAFNSETLINVGAVATFNEGVAI